MVRAKTKLEMRMRILGCTGRELAELSGVTQQSVSLAKKKGLRVPGSWRKYAKALHCKVADLIEDEER